MPDFSSIVGLKDPYSNDDIHHPVLDLDDGPVHTGEAQDFFGDEDFDVGGAGGFDDAPSMAGDEDGPAEQYRGGVGMVAPGDSHGPFDPRRQGHGELVMALAGGEDEEGMFDYFDRGLGKSWAGAEHWKLRKVSRKGTKAPSSHQVERLLD